MEMKFCIWGCGVRGKNVFRFMNRGDVRAFIDSSPALQGTEYEGVPVVGFERYLAEYRDCVVIVTPHYEHYELLAELERKGVEALSALLLPPEIFETPVPELFEIIEKKTGAGDTLFLYGLNLYSLLLLERFRHKRPVRVIPEEGAAEWLRRRTETCFPGCLGTLEEVGGSTLYLTGRRHESLDVPVKSKVQLYDFMPDIKAYRNPQIAKLKDVHKGKRCFIVATGPSLRMEDLERLREQGELCVSVNGIIRAYDSTAWRPDYYVLEDQRRFQDFKADLLGKYRVENMLIADVCLREASVPAFQRFHLSFLEITPDAPPLFSEDFSMGAYSSGTVVYDCLQLAVYMGCTEIYLYGVDHNYRGADRHFTAAYAETHVKSGQIQYEQERAALAYQAARQRAEELGVKIFNASRRTGLEVFERVDFDEVLGKGEAAYD